MRLFNLSKTKILEILDTKESNESNSKEIHQAWSDFKTQRTLANLHPQYFSCGYNENQSYIFSGMTFEICKRKFPLKSDFVKMIRNKKFEKNKKRLFA